jgi:hypothetical protein
MYLIGLCAAWVVSLESGEMLGIMEQLRYNGLHHSPATQTRRSSRMRVKLQLACVAMRVLKRPSPM